LASGQPFYQIGTDSVFLEKTEKIKEFILLVAERLDVIIDFSQYYGQTIILKNVTKSASLETTDVMTGSLKWGLVNFLTKMID
jgi:spore coat protein A